MRDALPSADPSPPAWEEWLTVTQLNEEIRDLLEGALPFVRVRGEISDLHQPASGHLYFTLVDEQARVRAVVWRSSRQRMRLTPRTGDAVLVTGRVAVYPPRGEYQLVVEGMQAAGAGTERERFLHLFNRLKREGLFAEERKRPLPLLPDVIGVVTSASGAALQDIIRVLDLRFPGYQLLLAHARVQGEGASGEIVAALQGLFADGRAQVIICGRGGGAAEDLAAFNSEEVVRAIAASPVPVISAVGHEVDLTLADLVADLRASTPSAAAERVMPEKSVLQERLLRLRQRLQRGMRALLERQRARLRQQRMLHPRRRLEYLRVRSDELLQRMVSGAHYGLRRRSQRLEALHGRLAVWAEGAFLDLLRARLLHAHRRLQQAALHHLERRRQRLARADVRLRGVSPLAILQRGYAVVHDQRGVLLRGVDGVQVGEAVQIRLAQGAMVAVIHQLKEMNVHAPLSPADPFPVVEP
ncbi:MAG: exodeoxyribonuclease VII large subunit [Magnetococcus sp. MYC-9]